ncbi:hypothetical protein GT347_07020 [Xylophilus rhododendri]|uniref:ABC-type transport auxiliary lipoprotein component domain-containing protein n=1 Tax=Xylophilus rhododendri TaxID=2697032 RepID=A0A857J3D4_9BURK|nr:PqiC family protein [Xylophilus rhododendri]QHI97763.1 hypothetical protein GT347_07020 [Xylophilus rhododendri]
MKLRHATLLACVSALALAAAGCASSEKERYYTLAAPALASAPAIAAGGAPLYIDMGAVALPERLARQQMLVRQDSDGAEMRLLEKSRWASSLENEMRDALAAGVAARLGAIDVTRQPRAGQQPTWRIAVRVQRFDAVEDSRLDAAFSWNLRRSDLDRNLNCAWSTTQPVGAGIPALAEGAQRATAQAAEAIARQIAALQADPAAACLR